jgi:hypothetical protein
VSWICHRCIILYFLKLNWCRICPNNLITYLYTDSAMYTSKKTINNRAPDLGFRRRRPCWNHLAATAWAAWRPQDLYIHRCRPKACAERCRETGVRTGGDRHPNTKKKKKNFGTAFGFKRFIKRTFAYLACRCRRWTFSPSYHHMVCRHLAQVL